MHRTPFVLTATAAGLAGVISYHAHSRSFGGFPAAAAGSVSSPKRSQPHPGGPGVAASGSAGTPGSSTPSVAAPTPLVARQSTGPLVPYGYGELAVKVNVSGGKITSVNVVRLRTAEQYSQSLAQQVVPMLRSEVMQAQSASINGVSGATYTSEAFAASLQGAMKHLSG
jgi:hypothetical protein